jgi:hypothetical protein
MNQGIGRINAVPPPPPPVGPAFSDGFSSGFDIT